MGSRTRDPLGPAQELVAKIKGLKSEGAAEVRQWLAAREALGSL